MKYFIFTICLVAAFSLGSYYQFNKTRNNFLSLKQIRAKNTNYPLVSRLIGSEMPSATTLGFYSDARKDIKTITAKKEYSDITHFSLYFKDLSTGLWFGISEEEEYIPASLFKIPIAISYFKKAIDDTSLFNKMLTYSNEEATQINSVQNLDGTTLQVGSAYSIKSLLSKMIVDSDNGAQRLLANNIDQKYLNDLFSIVEIKGPAQNHYYISPKEYSFFLRMLYNGSYLGLNKSEQLLELMSQTAFPYGIKKGVPEDVPVIHKFGSINFIDKQTNMETTGIHDCGIVYNTDKPYLLCIMTEGGNQQIALKEIEEVSAYLFSYVSGK